MTGSASGSLVIRGGKALRSGFTTGCCATAAAVGAAETLLSGQAVERVSVTLPGGLTADFDLAEIRFEAGRVFGAVTKDAGDDPDVTHGLNVGVTLEKIAEGYAIEGGPGVGVVTAEGLAVPPGQAAINPGPKKMILENLARVAEKYGYQGGFRVIISIPGGEEAARRTFNPRLGIVGGLSILGTTGLVEPMSERAVVSTIRLTIDQELRRSPGRLIITPGNYGRDFCVQVLGLDLSRAVKFANFLGECLDYLVYRKVGRVLLVGHLGKLVKVAGGIMNTHSSVADCRLEILAAHAALAGGSRELVRALMASVATEAAVAELENQGLAEPVFASLKAKIAEHLRYRVRESLAVEFIIFSGGKILLCSQEALALAASFKE